MRVVKTRGCASPGARAGASGKRGEAVASGRQAVLGTQGPGRRQPAQSLLLSGLVQPCSLPGQRPPLWPWGARTPGFPAPPLQVSASGQRLGLSRAYLARPDARVPRGARVLGWGTGLQWGAARQPLGRGNQTALSGPEPSPRGGRGKADVLTPGLAGRSALWGPLTQQCLAPWSLGPPPSQQSSGLLQPGGVGAEKELSLPLG